MASNFDDPKIEHTFTSGQPGTTGREPFEQPAGTFGDHQGEAGTHRGEHHHESGFTGGLGQHSGTGNTGGLSGHHSGTGAGTDLTGSSSYDNESSRHSHGSGQHGTGAGSVGVGSQTQGSGLAGAARGAENEVRRDTGGEGLTTHSHSGQSGDRTGNLDQGAAAYERTTNQGPITGGAAGTDRFDSDRHGQHDGPEHHTVHTHGTEWDNDGIHKSTNTGDNSDVNRNPAEARAQPSGGGLSGLTTTDGEFTGRDRKGGTQGAYGDSEGPFQGNTSGPGGNVALTGREGSTEKNPVAHAKAAGNEVGSAPSGTSTHPGVDETAGEHKGFVQKIKDML